MDRICPLLALAADGRSVVDGVDAGHRCHAEPTPMALDRRQQAQVCLTPSHESCERFLQHAARVSATRRLPAPITDGLVSTRMVLTPEPAWRGIAGRARRAPSGRMVGLAAVAVVVAAGGAAAAAVFGGGVLPAAVGSPSPTPSQAATPVTTLSATPNATPSPAPTATPSPSPAPTPSSALTPPPSPTTAPPSPTPARIYVVQQGDTLAAIADQFGTTVEELQAANGIDDPNLIVVGQVLVIP